MVKRLTRKFLKSHSACSSGNEFAEQNRLINKSTHFVADFLIHAGHITFLEWLIINAFSVSEMKKFITYMLNYIKKNTDINPKYLNAFKNRINNPTDRTRAALLLKFPKTMHYHELSDKLKWAEKHATMRKLTRDGIEWVVVYLIGYLRKNETHCKRVTSYVLRITREGCNGK